MHAKASGSPYVPPGSCGSASRFTCCFLTSNKEIAMSEISAWNAPPPLLVCHSHLRWDWVYQRPQHLLSRLARHAPVIVEEEPVTDDRPPGLDALHVAPGVTVLRPHRPAESEVDLAA